MANLRLINSTSSNLMVIPKIKIGRFIGKNVRLQIKSKKLTTILQILRPILVPAFFHIGSVSAASSVGEEG